MHDLNLSTPSFLSPSLTWPLGLEDGRIQVRRWLMDGGDPAQLASDGIPVWASAMAAGHPEAVEELLDAGANLELRDPDGNGWLHWAIQSGQSVVLTLLGMARLGPTWWAPNADGLTPFHLPSQPLAVAQAMGARFWAEQQRWGALVGAGGDPAHLAEAAGMPPLALAWRYWQARCKA